MSVDKFKFVSPGVFIDEIDESGIPSLPERMGPVVVGRFKKGPGLRPVKVNSYKEFVSLFGEPSPGNASGDIWRSGEMTAPTYAAYAVKAWLRNNSPCTVYRVLGQEASNAAATAAGQAGWSTNKALGITLSGKGGAYGMFILPSGSATTRVTGTLAAIWYLEEGAVVLSGTARVPGDPGSGNTTKQGAGVFILNNGTQKWTAKVLNGSGVVQHTAQFDFDRDSDTFIRKVFNTDPTATNSDILSSTKNYWLGETFESNVRAGENGKLAKDGTKVQNSVDMVAVILGLGDGAGSDSVVWSDHKQNTRAAQTGWFISQDVRGSSTSGFNPIRDTKTLFKFHALDSGEQANRDYKVSIVDVTTPSDNFNTFGTFTVQVRSAYDLDKNPVILEQYSNCNLNPTSPNYIGRLIGDRYYTYDATNRRVIEHGDNENRSKILRIELNDDIKNGNGAGLHPYGVYGPTVPITEEVLITDTKLNYAASSGSIPVEVLAGGASGSIVHAHPPNKLFFHHATGSTDGQRADNIQLHALTASIEWPTTRLRTSSSEGDLTQPKKAYFGYQSNVKGTKRFDQANYDLLRGHPAAFDPTGLGSNSERQYSWIFTLDDIKESPDNNLHSIWVSGSRNAGTSWTAASGSAFILTGSNAGFKKFTSPMFGGFDGFDVTEKDPFRNSYMNTPVAATDANNSSFYSLKKAIDVLADPDYVEFDVATIPGLTLGSLNSRLVSACEDRADSLAIIDPEGGYVPPHENTKNEENNVGSVETTVRSLRDLNINSSYGCAFYPWVKIRDTGSNALLYVPPSVVALGTLSSAQRKSAVWFAPAGFTRGGLSEGSAGLPVIGVRQRLTSAERDRLYDANINPIASFPAEGIVIFGQKTLQVTKSALDRINVRRLLIYLKKEISRIASRILFDQNVQQTWDRFTGQIIPFLESVQAGLGLTDFRVVLDDTTTTPDLVDRNILYAKIFLKPARAVEFIALDFIITRSGASFDD